MKDGLVALVAACLAGCYPSYTFDLDDACVGSSLPGTSALSDAFDGAALSSDWETWGNCAPELDGGQLLVDLPSSVHAYCGIRTVALHHLTCDSVTVKIPEVTTASGVQTFVFVDNEDESDTIQLGYGGSFFLQHASGSGIAIESDYDPTSDLWWRLREAGGEIFFETSPDAQSFRERGHAPAPLPLDAVRVRLGAGNDTRVADPGSARFDCYNVPTGCP